MSRLIAVVLAITASIAPVVAASMVPDPTWIGGFYDGADGDELATLNWDRAAAVPVAAEPPARPTTWGPAPPPPRGALRRLPPSAHRSRSPPVASLAAA